MSIYVGVQDKSNMKGQLKIIYDFEEDITLSKETNLHVR